jgi:hypothetical protein
MAAALKIVSDLQRAVDEEGRSVQALAPPSAAPTLVADEFAQFRPICRFLALSSWPGSVHVTSDTTIYTTMALAEVTPAVRLDEDFHGWLLDQAAALRNRNTFTLDWDHLAEELEAMAAADRRELLRRLTTLFEHLLKLRHQSQEVSRRGRLWRLTVTRTRTEIDRLLSQSPGLKGQLTEFVTETYADARRIAGEAMSLTRPQWEALLPQQNPWTIEQALAHDFFPSV